MSPSSKSPFESVNLVTTSRPQQNTFIINNNKIVAREKTTKSPRIPLFTPPRTSTTSRAITLKTNKIVNKHETTINPSIKGVSIQDCVSSNGSLADCLSIVEIQTKPSSSPTLEHQSTPVFTTSSSTPTVTPVGTFRLVQTSSSTSSPSPLTSFPSTSTTTSPPSVVDTSPDGQSRPNDKTSQPGQEKIPHVVDCILNPHSVKCKIVGSQKFGLVKENDQKQEILKKRKKPKNFDELPQTINDKTVPLGKLTPIKPSPLVEFLSPTTPSILATTLPPLVRVEDLNRIRTPTTIRAQVEDLNRIRAPPTTRAKIEDLNRISPPTTRAKVEDLNRMKTPSTIRAKVEDLNRIRTLTTIRAKVEDLNRIRTPKDKIQNEVTPRTRKKLTQTQEKVDCSPGSGDRCGTGQPAGDNTNNNDDNEGNENDDIIKTITPDCATSPDDPNCQNVSIERFVGCLEGGVGPDCAGPGIVTTSGPGPGLPPVTDKLCSGTNCISGPGPCQDGRCQDNKTPPSPPVSSTKPPSPRIPPSTVDQFRNKENVQECHPGLDGEVVCSFPADPTVESLLQNKAMECVNGDCDEEACARHPACQDRDKNKSNKKNGSHSTFVKNKDMPKLTTTDSSTDRMKNEGEGDLTEDDEAEMDCDGDQECHTRDTDIGHKTMCPPDCTNTRTRTRTRPVKKNRRPKQFTKNRNNNVPAPFTAFRTKPVQLEEITPTLNDIVPRVPLQKDFNEVNKFPRQKNVIEKQTDLTKASNNDQEEERGAKQLNNNKNIYEDDDEDYEPTPEPEPSHHGDPRYHAFHSWLYQKIDPKVRAARRKKFFGSGRKKRDIDLTSFNDHKYPEDLEKISMNLGVKKLTIDDNLLLKFDESTIAEAEIENVPIIEIKTHASKSFQNFTLFALCLLLLMISGLSVVICGRRFNRESLL